jgi:hypothetical protein
MRRRKSNTEESWRLSAIIELFALGPLGLDVQKAYYRIMVPLYRIPITTDYQGVVRPLRSAGHSPGYAGLIPRIGVSMPV